MYVVSFFFFFQAEDGIRDIGVTGVQTCALPILTMFMGLQSLAYYVTLTWLPEILQAEGMGAARAGWMLGLSQAVAIVTMRSEERRVGKECRSRWSPYH